MSDGAEAGESLLSNARETAAGRDRVTCRESRDM
jgi:hypothetical protein